ncbi:MAG TPA: DUF2971 domain-containing protein [Bacteroidales bacterium]|nr:DUF2971 domain-containing protein [Bacteroidales bacterium]
MVFPPIVYKYRNWTDPNHKTIITNREVFFASPNSFTDQNDCKIPIRYDLLSYIEVEQKIKADNPNWCRQQRRKFLKDWYRGHRENVMRVQQEFLNDFFDRFGVLSLTEIPDNNFMWFIYANDFKGFCVGYKSNIMFQHLGGGGQVIYYDTLPVIYPTPKNTFEEQHQLQIFSKLREWEFEKEYRTHIFSKDPLSINQRKKQLPPEAFKEIIFGKNMPDAIKEDLLRSIPPELGHVILVDQ